MLVMAVTISASDKMEDDSIAHIVWADPTSEEYAIFYSMRKNENWLKPVKLSEGNELNVTPSISVVQSGVIWVVWSIIEGSDIHLYYRRYLNNKWEEKTIIETGLKSNTSPGLLADGDNNLWLTWSGNNGGNDEVFISQLTEGGYVEPVQLTINAIPDILPELSKDLVTGLPVVNWVAPCDTGHCRFLSKLVDGVWSEPIEFYKGGDLYVNTQADKVKHKVIDYNIPDFIEKKESLSIYFNGKSFKSPSLQQLKNQLVEQE